MQLGDDRSRSGSGFRVRWFRGSPIPRPGCPGCQIPRPTCRIWAPNRGTATMIVGARRMKTTCPLCSTRKAKRACPGVHREICAVCCGTKRLTEIACPPDCPYLATARVHPPAVVMRQQDRDMGFVLPRISDLTEMQYRLFLYLQALVLQHAQGNHPLAARYGRRRCRGDGRGHAGDGRQRHHLRASGAIAAGAAARIGDWSIGRRARAARGRAGGARRTRRGHRAATNGARGARGGARSARRSVPRHQLALARRQDDERRRHRSEGRGPHQHTPPDPRCPADRVAVIGYRMTR